MCDDGGPAYPCKWTVEGYAPGGGVAVTERESAGMSLRDRFAEAALRDVSLQSGIQYLIHHEEPPEKIAERIAATAYLVADAMLKERKKS